MKKIRCCMIPQKQAYRGIDREVTMRVFGKAKKKAYNTAFEYYLRYLCCEEEYSTNNLSIMHSFSQFISSSAYGNSEVVLYSIKPIENDDSLIFVGIDVINEHLDSFLKNKEKVLTCKVNQYGLCFCEQDATAVITQMKNIKGYDDLYYVYVYIIVGYCRIGDGSLSC